MEEQVLNSIVNIQINEKFNSVDLTRAYYNMNRWNTETNQLTKAVSKSKPPLLLKKYMGKTKLSEAVIAIKPYKKQLEVKILAIENKFKNKMDYDDIL